ncbi:MAG TPA: hypothetical protein DEO41_07840 [Betaproteobacteria bacterium]|nr:hypothetical protein [Betaproteobacteria bacterium]
MEQLSFFLNRTPGPKLRRSISAIRDRVDQSASRSNVGVTGKLRELNSTLPRFTRITAINSRSSDDFGAIRTKLVTRDILYRSNHQSQSRGQVSICQVARGRQFIPHQHIVNAIERALVALRINPDEVDVAAEYGSYGAQMSLVVSLPSFYDFDPGSMDPFRLQVVLHNCLSRGGLRLLARWFQEGTGATYSVGVTQLNASLAHRIPAREENILPTFRKAIELAREDCLHLGDWTRQAVSKDALETWLVGSVRRMWGKKAQQALHSEFESDEGIYSREGNVSWNVLDTLMVLASYCAGTKDILLQCDQVVEGAVLMRSLLKKCLTV